jgi:hypothetical protein
MGGGSKQEMGFPTECKSKVFRVLTQTPRHEDVLESGGTVVHFNLGTR